MDDPNSGSSEISSGEESSIKTNSWNINLNEEKNYWKNKLFKQYLYNPDRCPKCFNVSFNIYEKKKEDILNPFYVRCSKKNADTKKV